MCAFFSHVYHSFVCFLDVKFLITVNGYIIFVCTGMHLDKECKANASKLKGFLMLSLYWCDEDGPQRILGFALHSLVKLL